MSKRPIPQLGCFLLFVMALITLAEPAQAAFFDDFNNATSFANNWVQWGGVPPAANYAISGEEMVQIPKPFGFGDVHFGSGLLVLPGGGEIIASDTPTTATPIPQVNATDSMTTWELGPNAGGGGQNISHRLQASGNLSFQGAAGSDWFALENYTDNLVAHFFSGSKWSNRIQLSLERDCAGDGCQEIPLAAGDTFGFNFDGESGGEYLYSMHYNGEPIAMYNAIIRGDPGGDNNADAAFVNTPHGVAGIPSAGDPSSRILQYRETEPLEQVTMFSWQPTGAVSQLTYESFTVGEPPPPPTSSIWKGTQGGTWNADNSWQGLGIPSPATTGGKVEFSGRITADSTVVIDAPATATTITFDNPNSYFIAGTETLTLVDDGQGVDPSITVVQGSHDFTARVSLGSDTTTDVAGGSVLSFQNELSLNGNTLTKNGAGETAINNNVISDGGMVLVQAGVVSGSGTVGGDVDNSGGTISPGNSPGTMEILGDYSQGARAALRMEIAGPDVHDQLLIGGVADIAGDLEVVLVDDFAPSAGENFDLLDFDAIIGEFDNIILPALNGGLSWDVSDLTGSGVLSVVPEPTCLLLIICGLGAARFVRRRGKK